MYNYMRALHQRFFHETAQGDYRSAVDAAQEKLLSKLEKSDRIILLQLLDDMSRWKNEVSLDSFAAGFRLAAGLAKELESDGLYSFDDEETERICKELEHRKPANKKSSPKQNLTAENFAGSR